MAKLEENDIFKPTGLEMATDAETLGLEVRKYRLRNGLTQAQLGERWGLSRWSIIRIEKGKLVGWQAMYRMFARLARELAEETPL